LQEKKRDLDSRTFAQEYLGEFLSAGDTFLSHEDVMPCVADETELSGKIWLGVDVARKGKDRTVYTAVDENKVAKVLASEDTSTIPGIVGRIKQLHSEYGFESVLVDENAVGGGVVDDEDLNSMNLVNGVKFTTKSKHEMYNRLKTDFESREITIPQNRRLIDELTALEFDVTRNGYYQISHPEGGHDDFADSLALANWGEKGTTKVTRRNGNRPRSGSTI
jgi:phage FluMu gp28-like protein